MRFFAACLGWLWLGACFAGEVQIEHLRMWPAPDHTRLVFDMSGPAVHRIFTLDDPYRVVIDIRGVGLATRLDNVASEHNLVERIRSAAQEEGELRVVLDTRQAVRPKSFLLKPGNTYGHRLVVDLTPTNPDESVRPRATKTSAPFNGRRDVVIALDPGHGGEDPGAIGPSGTYEKDVTLAVSKRLKALIDAERGMSAVLIRTGDYYVRLRKRMQIARDARADLYVALHADAFRDARVHGTAVYILSHNGASSEAARWLAAQENASDLVGGVSLDDKDDLLASVLLDLSQTATLSASADAGAAILTELRRLGKTHKKSVQRAGFVVLKSPDIPSLLVETGFISNPGEERKLVDTGYQQALSGAILRGLKGYFEKHAAPGTLLALRKHVISKGDTLSGIASQYQVSVGSLKEANRLDSDLLKVGQVLRIPNTSGS